jgi:hypothetical protein
MLWSGLLETLLLGVAQHRLQLYGIDEEGITRNLLESDL